ncbi:hypothetical protein P5673_001916 [Acropora cervicornis]|uniref:Uncharacterized protein n=1 Tax=Acropora cervicornis TaxID=6130 RepID=A0AAD9R4H5_ACRCE|nr:hypothetical protein P5673_001916 [Acropora cervicornis]
MSTARDLTSASDLTRSQKYETYRSSVIERVFLYLQSKVYLDNTSPNRGSKGGGICGMGMSRLEKRSVVKVNGQ